MNVLNYYLNSVTVVVQLNVTKVQVVISATEVAWT